MDVQLLKMVDLVVVCSRPDRAVMTVLSVAAKNLFKISLIRIDLYDKMAQL